MKKRLPLILACLLAAGMLHAQRIKYNFNYGWKVWVGDDSTAAAISFNDASWKNVSLPYAWNEDAAFKLSIDQLPTGIAWYRKRFTIPAEQKDKKIFLEFEGIRQAGEFYLNGQWIGRHENGVMAFGFDISDKIQPGKENILAVRIDNSWDYRERSTNTKFQWIDKNFNANYGGINKNVYLHITNKLYQTLPLYSNLGTTGTYVYADNFKMSDRSADINAESEVYNAFNDARTFIFQVQVKDATGKALLIYKTTPFTLQPGQATTVAAKQRLAGLNFWSWGYGYLYTVTTSLLVNGAVTDAVNTVTGFRKTEFKDGMVYLNDRVIQMKGYAQRTTNEWPAVGIDIPAWLSDYSNGLMVKSNANLVRWMHITPSKQDIESCDRVGLIQAMPAGDAEADVNGTRWQQRTLVMRDAIIYNRNNPSIIFYECGNENISEAHMADMKKIRDQYDPHGGRAIGSREMLDSKIAEYGGEMLYINKSAGKPVWAMEYSRDEGLRKYWDEYSPPYHKEGDGPLYKGAPAIEYNHNQDEHAIENIRRWYDYWHERPGTGKRVSSGGVNIIFSETNTHYRGAENYRRSGEVDALRIIKEGYYAHQVMWNGWVDVEKQGIHILCHWNYAAGVKKPVYVVAAADKVELFINGRSKGFGKQAYRFLYTFPDIQWEPGTIKAVGYDAAGKKLSETALQTVGEPVALRLNRIASPVNWLANGADIALVEVEVVDANGNRCPVAMNMINFSVDGPVEWRGGMAQGPDNYILSKTLPVECGVNRVLLRSGTQAGTITVKAVADGLKPATLSLTTVPVKVNNGLAENMPGDGLKGNLERGPTPATPSYTVSRKAVGIIKATAGANTDSTIKSYDDNELSDWFNDGKLSTAWIEYELEREATVSEITLKLNNFRTRTYPLQVSIDGKVVYRDSTQRSLGYVTLSFAPQKGKRVKIQLLEAGGLQEVAGTEMNGKKLDDGVSRNDGNAKGRLSIIEAEIYEKAGIAN
ncbi:MAG: DUF4982 domain-containing protein [Chitinophagaceae bacterium]